MEIIKLIIDFILHIDVHLGEIMNTFGGWTYAILFFIIFIETGLVVTPFLPGDSLLFAAGALAKLTGALDIKLLYLFMVVAAVLGDTANYWIGHFVGPKVFKQESKLFKKEYLERTHAFYEKHGGKTIFLARFIPIIRTFAPFVAGIGRMSYGHFISYNIIGGFIWPGVCLFSGYLFATNAFVQEHFSLVAVAIILISVVPIFIEWIKARKDKKKASVKVEEVESGS